MRQERARDALTYNYKVGSRKLRRGVPSGEIGSITAQGF